MGHFRASVHVGVRFKAQVHHHGDGPGLLGSCHLKSGLLDQVKSRSLPNKAVDVMACKLSGDRLMFASSTHGSLDPVPSSLFSVYAACCTIALEATSPTLATMTIEWADTRVNVPIEK